MLACLVVATLVSVGVGLVVTGPLDDSLGAWDRQVVEDLASGRTTTLDRVTALVGQLAEVVPVAVLWPGAMVVAAWLTRRWEAPLVLLFAIGGEKLTFLVTSVVVDRPRPPVEPLGTVFGTGSFPSGHVGSAVTLYGGIVVVAAWHRRVRGRPLPTWTLVLSTAAVVAVAGSVAWSRTYRGQHHPSDVAWGALLGAAWLAAGWFVVLRPTRRDASPIDDPAQGPTSAAAQGAEEAQAMQRTAPGRASRRSVPMGPPQRSHAP